MLWVRFTIKGIISTWFKDFNRNVINSMDIRKLSFITYQLEGGTYYDVIKNK